MTYRFAGHELDPERAELKSASGEVALKPLAFRLLVYLVERRERVVAKAELLDALWGQASVVDSVVTTAIHQVRAALGDSAAEQRIIKTVPRRGYRFVAAVRRGGGAAPASVPATEERRSPPDPPDSFVGRRRVLEQLTGALDAALSGEGQLILLTGEPGIGKTRTGRELGSIARDRGARFCDGWCEDRAHTPPYWPWVQVVRQLIETADPTTLAQDLGEHACDLAALVPGIRTLLPDVAPSNLAGSELGRFALCDAVGRYLEASTRREPLVVFLDDLHCADPSSLDLLGFVARQVQRSRLLVVAAYRSGGPDEAGREHLDRVVAQAPGLRIRLEGLALPELEELVRARAGDVAARRWSAAIKRQTGGNPYFASEFVSGVSMAVWEREGADGAAGLPVAAQDLSQLILNRWTSTSERCRETLERAALLGRPIYVDRLAGLSGAAAKTVQENLDEACAAGLLVTDSGGFAFSHPLIQEALYRRQPAGRRRRTHARAADLLEAEWTTRASRAEIAYHALEALPEGDLEQLVRRVLQAVGELRRLFAYADAIALCDRALAALSPTDPGWSATRCDLLLARADLELASGARAQARSTFLRVAALARSRADGARLALAALGIGGETSRFGVLDDELSALLEEALLSLGEGSPSLRASLLARMTFAAIARDHESGRELADRALAIARTGGDRRALAEALHARIMARAEPGQVDERLAQATEMLRYLDEGDGYRLYAQRCRLWAFMERGEMQAARLEQQAYRDTAQRLRSPSALWFASAAEAGRALYEGRLKEAETLGLETIAAAQRDPNPITTGLSALLMFWIVREQGRLAEVKGMAEANLGVMSGPVEGAVLEAVVAFMQAELGDTSPARLTLERAVASDFTTVPGAFDWLSTMTLHSEVALRCRNLRAADALYSRLLPFARLQVVSGWSVLCFGSVSRWLGRLATELDRFDNAGTHLALALAANERCGARLAWAHTAADHAELARAARRGGDPEVELWLERARAVAGSLELEAVLARCREIASACSN